MKKKLIAIIMIMPMIFTACLSKKSQSVETKDEFKKVLNDINKNREDINQRVFSMDEKYANWFKKEEDLTEEECKIIFNKGISRNSFNRNISINEAKEDVDMLFKIFRYCYGAYGYFGGDKTFNKAKEDILKGLESKKDISIAEFEELIFNNLKFIKDMHLCLGNSVAFESAQRFSKKYYINSNCYFFKDDKGYYKITENKKYYVEIINEDKEIDKFMKLTITEEGKLAYTIAILDDLDKDDSLNRVVNIKYTDDDKKIEKLTLTQINNSGRTYDKPVYYIDNNVPVAQLRAMNAEQYEFSESGEKLKDYPVSIIDLRGTGGGSVIPGLKWFENYTGGKCETNREGFKLNSNYYKYNMLQQFNYNIGDKPLFDVVKQNNSKVVPNKNIIFLLVDKANLSASELFIEYMRQMNNVILVGTNTSGCNLSLDIIQYRLKNSRIHFNLGSVFCMTPYFDGFEFKGFEPDILVESSKSLERIQKLIEYYGLNKKK